jgi:GTP cyclohydrolase I
MNTVTDKGLSQAGAMPDVQGSRDDRNLAIDRVGVRSLRYPVLVQTEKGPAASVATFSMAVALPAEKKGTHMSRFVALLETMNKQGWALSPESIAELSRDLLVLLEAQQGSLSATFPFFIEKSAPVSGVKSLMDYQVVLQSESSPGRASVAIEVRVPVKSLCPCSKEISEYGAHNQRSEVSVRTVFSEGKAPSLETLIRAVESQASCELWGLLKRPDEKYVTERAYDNAKFVEDLVRDVALSVKAFPGLESFCVEAENFESIHNHSAWARITG